VKILLIDDEKAITEFFSTLARGRGYSAIDTVGSAEEALTRVLRQTYELITLDIQMPGVSGLEIIAMLRNMNPHAVIAIISGYIPEEISSEVAGCVDVMISKPVSVSTFNHLLDGASQICQTLDQIRTLGRTPAVAR